MQKQLCGSLGIRLKGFAASAGSLTSQSSLKSVQPELTEYCHRRAHFLAMCMKLVYERPACIEDTVESRWACAGRSCLQVLTRVLLHAMEPSMSCSACR